MSLYGMMRTGTSGMQSQSNRLGTVADNIANSSTTAYKRADTQFSTLVIPNGKGSYASGGVTTDVRYGISQQGVLQYTTSTTDLAINGSGFFVVQDSAGSPYLTRSGSFVANDQGQLVNAAGYYLLGYSFANGTPSATANGFAGLEPIAIEQQEMIATPSSFGNLAANLDFNAEIVDPADLPSANGFNASPTNKTSLEVYDNLGATVLVDIFFTKTADNTWEVAIYNQADAAPGTGFPYGGPALVTDTFVFDQTTGKLTAASPDGLTVPIPNGAALELDMRALSQLASDFELTDAEVNGSPASSVKDVQIDADGTVYARFENGTLRPLARIPLANVASPDKLLVITGNVYSQSGDSGDVRFGFATDAGFGSISSGALESSNVDIATELTAMIEAQRSYTANSKVFQTGSDLMDILVNLKR